MTRQQRKAAAFEALHRGVPFIIPNPWDAGSARLFAGLGFEALATTSSGFAFTLGRHDGQATLDEVLENARQIDLATDLPVSVDLENGHGPRPEDAARAVARAAEAGAVGGSIEDYDRTIAWSTRPAGQSSACAQRSRPRDGFPSGSCSRRAPRTSCGATPTSTTRLRGFGPSDEWLLPRASPPR